MYNDFMTHLAETEETIGSRIRRLRIAKKMSQAELAEAAGTHKQYISRLEQPNYGPTGARAGGDMTYRIACGLGATVGELLGYESRDDTEEMLLRYYRASESKREILKVVEAMS